MKRVDKNYLGMDKFVWWVGVVEDINDPLKVGRVRVRCFEWHPDDKKVLPTKQLPWSQVIMPPHSASNAGIGHSPTGLINGSWVVGFFVDGEQAQRPIIMGSLPGIPSDVADPNKGFNDPQGVYPQRPQVPQDEDKEGILSRDDENYAKKKNTSHTKNEPDTNRLARNDVEVDKEGYPKYAHKVVADKIDGLALNIKKASGGSYAEPGNFYNPTYPHNQVFETKAGHIKEYDNTPGQERIHEYHKSGSFNEVVNDGTKIDKTVRDRYIIVNKDDQVYIKGDAFFTVDGNCDTYIGGNWNITVGGNKVEKVSGSVKETYSSTAERAVTNNYKVTAKKIDLNPKPLGLVPGLSGLAGGFMSGIMGGALGSVMGSIGGIAQSGFGGIGDLAGGLTNGVASLASGAMGGALSAATGALGSGITSSLGGALGGVSSLASGALGGGLGSLAGTASFMSGTGLTGALGAVSSGFNIGNIVSGASSLIPGITGSLTSLGGIVPDALSGFVGEGGGFLSDAVANVSNFGGDLGFDKVFSSVGDFTGNLTSNLNINKVLGESGAGILGGSIGDMLDVSSNLNGLTSDIFSGTNILGATNDIIKKGTNLLGSGDITSNLTNGLGSAFNAQKLLKSATSSTFGALDFPSKITEAFDINNAVDGFISNNPIAQKVRSVSGLTDFAFKQDFVSEAVGQIGDKLLDSTNAGRIVNLASDASDQLGAFKAVKRAAETGLDSLGNSAFLSEVPDINPDIPYIEI